MKDILAEITAFKKKEISLLAEPTGTLRRSQRDFLSVISRKKSEFPHLIAEIKPASPSKGRLLPTNVDIGRLAQAYESAGAAGISVLTDYQYFDGSFENLRIVSAATASVPIFCKDFILDAKQIRLARFYGADSFLLIARILAAAQIQDLLDEGRKYGMEAMVEIADAEDLKKVLTTNAKIIGINNRDLRDFSLDIKRTFQLAKKLPEQLTIISLSGFVGPDVRLVKHLVSAVLVGSNIGTATDPAGKIADYLRPKPLLKLCGVRTLADARFADGLGIDLLGLNFVPTSKRRIDRQSAGSISQSVCNAKLVGVFQNQSPEFVQQTCLDFKLSFAQLSGSESAEDFRDFPVPIIKGISVAEQGNQTGEAEAWQAVADLFLFDGKIPGSGATFPHQLLPKTKLPFLVAGGVRPENACEIWNKTGADGIDTASGIEDPDGNWDQQKIRTLLHVIGKSEI